MSASAMSAEPTKCLLIVDDRPEILRSVKRFMAPLFRDVLVASTPEEAEAHLRSAAPEVLLCDYWLGPDLPTGTELISRWRVEFPCLRRLVLMTGTKPSALLGTEHADRVFEKPLDMPALKAFLLGGA